MAFFSTSLQTTLNEVARRLGRMPSGEELAAAGEAKAWKATLKLWDDTDVRTVLTYLRAHPLAKEANAQPPYWQKYSDVMLQAFGDEQAQALELFGLERRLELGEVAGFLIDRARSEPAAGDRLTLSLPSSRGAAEEAVLFFRGYFEDEWQRRLRERGQTDDEAEYARRLEETLAWQTARATTLYRFSLLVSELTEAMDMGEDAAIGFLLTDAHVRLPRLAVRPQLRWNGRSPATTVTLSIYDLSVEPEEVELAYRRVRSALLAGRILPRPTKGPRKRSRTPSKRTLELLLFCRARKNTKRFPEIRTDWNTAHPTWQYETYQSLYNAYRVAEDRWGPSRPVDHGSRGRKA